MLEDERITRAGQVRFRPASPNDANDIADSVIEAGHGLYEIIFKMQNPAIEDFAALLKNTFASTVRNPSGMMSYKRCRVGIISQRPVAWLRTYPASLIPREIPEALAPQLRELNARQLPITPTEGFFIGSMGVRADVRQKGIGIVVLREALRLAVKEGAERINLHVAAENRPARSLYEKFGFKTEGSAVLFKVPGTQREYETLLMARSVHTG